MMFQLNWIPIAGAVIVTGLASYGLHSCNVNGLEAKHTKALESQKISLEGQCNNIQQITLDVDNDLNKNLSAINGRITTDLVRPHACTALYAPSTPNSPGSVNGASGTRHAGHNGISTQWLRQYAAIANTYRAKVMACQMILSKERKKIK